MDWTDELIARLRALWDEGHSTAEIGRRLGISKNAVVGKAHRLSLPARPSPIRRMQDGTPPAPRAHAPRRVPAPSVVPQLLAQGHVQGHTPGRAPVQPAASSRPALVEERPRPALRPVAAAPRMATRSSPCCWPIGEPGTPDFHFCGANAMLAKPYCEEHAQLAYVKVRDRREEAA